MKGSIEGAAFILGLFILMASSCSTRVIVEVKGPINACAPLAIGQETPLPEILRLEKPRE